MLVFISNKTLFKGKTMTDKLLEELSSISATSRTRLCHDIGAEVFYSVEDMTSRACISPAGVLLAHPDPTRCPVALGPLNISPITKTYSQNIILLKTATRLFSKLFPSFHDVYSTIPFRICGSYYSFG